MKYRPEIDGLRAVAVIPVILFHAGFNAFSGGFIGVDVFFVISGYLITTIILSEMERGAFSLINFYERRARRILPALFLVMLVSFLFAWLWLLPNAMKDFSQSMVAVATFSSNILFWRESGYWDVASEMKPLLHTWSLAVEEQYYLLFPLFLMLMWRFRKRWILGSFMFIAGISLAAAQWGAYHYPSATFYFLVTRGWELAIGAGIAFYFLHKNTIIQTLLSHKVINEVLGLVGLLLIGYAVIAFNDQTPFPSFYALIPTIGTGLIIVFSSNKTIVGRLLGVKPLIAIGLISYSAYLWHQPIFVFARQYNLTQPNNLIYAALILLTFLLAYISWRFVEKPFRNRTQISRKSIFLFSGIGSMVFITIGVYGHISDGFASRLEVPTTVVDSIERNNAACFDREDAHKLDSWLCSIDGNDTKITSMSPPPDFLALGDSHMYSSLPALQVFAENKDITGAYTGFSGCPPILGMYSLRKDQNERNCHALNERIFEYVKASDIRDIILMARWTYYTDGNYFGDEINFLGFDPSDIQSKEHSREVFVGSLHDTIKAYSDIGVTVHLLLQIPMQKHEPLQAYQLAYRSGNFDSELFNELSITLTEHELFNEFVNQVFDELGSSFDNVHLYDPAAYLCDTDRCPIGTPDVSYYFDDNHLSVDGSKTLGSWLDINLSGIHSR